MILLFFFRANSCDDPIGEEKNNKSANALPGEADTKIYKVEFQSQSLRDER
jgi:hypothetical protein